MVCFLCMIIVDNAPHMSKSEFFSFAFFINLNVSWLQISYLAQGKYLKGEGY